MTTASDTRSQCRELATRFPKWACHDCDYCDGFGTLVASEVCHICDGRSYLPLPPNDMLAAVLRECRERQWTVMLYHDGSAYIYYLRKDMPEFGHRVEGTNLFAAFLAATEGERNARGGPDA